MKIFKMKMSTLDDNFAKILNNIALHDAEELVKNAIQYHAELIEQVFKKLN